jgi:hypothetical protein
MQFLAELWLPILVGSVATFVLSAVAWTVLPHHHKDYVKIPNEDAILDAIRAANATPGLYSAPHPGDLKQMGSPEMQAKYRRGPRVYLTVAPPWDGTMMSQLIWSFVTNVIIAVFVAYLAWNTLAPGEEYLRVFRVTGTATFMAYALGSMSDSVWFSKPWRAWGLHAADSLVYALVMGGIFGWLWA